MYTTTITRVESAKDDPTLERSAEAMTTTVEEGGKCKGERRTMQKGGI